MSYEKIMDEYIISHGDAWREKFEHARLYNYLPPFCDEEEFLRMAIHHTQERGYKPGYAAVLYKCYVPRYSHHSIPTYLR